jgi:cation transport ATPase
MKNASAARYFLLWPGTLTMGVPEVTGIRVTDGATENEVLQNAAIAEQHSEHPIGEAIIRKARTAKLSLREYSDLRYIFRAKA